MHARLDGDVATRRELHGIANEVEQTLAQAHVISDDVVRGSARLHREIDAGCACCRTHEAVRFGDHAGDRQHFALHVDAIRIKARLIENIAQQQIEMARG
ncbi:MAG: hypothetical protein IPG56_09780 [Caulobacteraceae bacterium]|nr:hypothetical protein [Caulobacteraceae bacterium]